MGISGGSSSSSPVDMTPQAFKGLQGPYAAVLGQLLGYNLTGANGQPVNPINFMNGGQTPMGPTSGQQAGVGQMGQGGGQGGGYIHSVRVPGGGSTGGNYELQGGGGGGGSGGSGGGSGAGGGMYLSNPNLGTGNPNDILNNIPKYQGPTTAGLGANEQSTLNQLQGQSYSGVDQANNNFLANTLNGQNVPGNTTPGSLNQFSQMVQGAHQTPGYNPAGENPFLQAAIANAQRPTLQGLTETLTRDLPGRFTQAGQMAQPQGSSAFDRAAAIATRGVADANAGIATNMAYQQFNDSANRDFQANQQARGAEDTSLQGQLARDNTNNQAAQDRQVQAAQTAPSVTGTQVQNMVQNLQAQALPRLIQQYGIQAGMDMFNNQMNGLLSTLGIAGGVTQPTVSQKSSSSQMGMNLK